jgi:hypothetical protein
MRGRGGGYSRAVTVHESRTTARLGVTVQASSLLLCSLIAAAASTVALGIVAIIQADANAGEVQGPNPVAPGDIPLIITAAIFVVSWIAVTFAFCRDQVLYRVSLMQANVAEVAAGQQAIQAQFAALRAELAEYAEQRETEGFLHGRRSAPTVDDRYEQNNGRGNGHVNGIGTNTGEVRPLHRVPPVD